MLIMLVNALALMRMGLRQILREDRRGEGYIWLFMGLMFLGALLWSVPRSRRLQAGVANGQGNLFPPCSPERTHS
jgi:hypothetical protein